MLSEKFYKKDIEFKIDHKMQSAEYMRGFMFACYILEAITKDTLDELKSYLKEREEKLDDKN